MNNDPRKLGLPYQQKHSRPDHASPDYVAAERIRALEGEDHESTEFLRVGVTCVPRWEEEEEAEPEKGRGSGGDCRQAPGRCGGSGSTGQGTQIGRAHV